MRHHTTSKLIGLALLVLGVGCTRTSLTYVPDGGGGECGSLTPTQCASDDRCELQAGCCGGSARCVPRGSPVYDCPACPSCAGLDEKQCNANPYCRADYCSECACTPTFVGCSTLTAPKMPCPAFACPVMQCDCSGLDEKSCIAAESTLGCTPAYCPTCGGGQQFSGCYGPNQGAPSCSVTCTSSCRTSTDCGNTGSCYAPGQPVCGGACPAGCNVDTDCASGQVCDYAACSCTPSGKTCQAACTATSCGAGQVCGSDGHCAPAPCSSTAQCPTNFDCVFPPAGGAPHCQRRACTGDAECGSGAYCVDGGCYGTLGTCELPRP